MVGWFISQKTHLRKCVDPTKMETHIYQSQSLPRIQKSDKFKIYVKFYFKTLSEVTEDDANEQRKSLWYHITIGKTAFFEP